MTFLLGKGKWNFRHKTTKKKPIIAIAVLQIINWRDRTWKMGIGPYRGRMAWSISPNNSRFYFRILLLLVRNTLASMTRLQRSRLDSEFNLLTFLCRRFIIVVL
jgi:hypothetical protein